jgi:predicted nucleic acid-binding protein
MQSMRICIDSSVFIPALQGSDPSAVHLIDAISMDLRLVIPRLIASEVSRNLTTREQVSQFYRLFHNSDFAHIVDEPVPRTLVEKYGQLGLPEKADAFIGAFAEWLQVDYLISDNRHFLRELKTDAFTVLTPDELIERIRRDTS